MDPGIKGELRWNFSINHIWFAFYQTSKLSLNNNPKTFNMFKIVALLALVAAATAAPGVISAGVLPASTGHLTYAVHAAPLAYAAAPVAYAAPVAVAHAAPVAIPAPVAYTSGVKVTHTYEPVEQHGYKIAY